AMIVVAFIMMVFVMPKLTVMYEDFGAELPFMTKALIGISNFMSTYWYVFVIIAGVIGYVFVAWKKTVAGSRAIDKLVLRIPVFGELRVKVMMSEFTRTIALLLGAGVSLL